MPYRFNVLTGRLDLVLPKEGAASDSTTGVVELATDAETVTGAATDKVTTPANITARLAAPGEIGGTTPGVVNATAIKVTSDSAIDGILTLAPKQIAKVLEASDAADNDRFGMSCALSSDGAILAVGAYQWEGASGADRGGVYIYDWSGAAWIQRGSVIEASDAADDDYFGYSCALSSDGAILAVGANYWEGASGTNRGGVYIYDWSGSAWVQRGSVIEASDAADNDYFGASCALSADGAILAVGANYWEGASGSDRGGVYIYDWSGSAWVQRGSVIEASDAADTDIFGMSCALSSDGTILAVGAYKWEGASGSNRGGVYIYDWSGAAWVQRGSVIEASDAADTDNFGISCALSSDGTILAVGAHSWEGASGTNRGGVYIYDWSGAAWVQRCSIIEASDAADTDYFGASCALSSDGTILAVGAFYWEGASGTDRGGVYTYALTANARPYSTNSNGYMALGKPIASEMLDVVGNVQIGDANAFYLGDSNTDESWRFIRSGTGLVIQRRESGTWTTKSTIAA